MFIPALYAIISVVVVSLISIIGLIALSLNEHTLRKIIFVLVSLAVGALFGDAFIHLIPEAYADSPNTTITSLLIIGGFLAFFILEKFLHFHHTHGEGDSHHSEDDCTHEAHAQQRKHPLGYMVLVADSFHNFIDGIIIGISYLISIEIGIASTIAIMLHEIPQEIGDFGILIHSGFTRIKALLLNLLSALVAIIGVIIVLLVGESVETLITWALPVAAGGFIYIAASDLVPELHKTKDPRRSFIQFIAILAGIGAMLLLLTLEI